QNQQLERVATAEGKASQCVTCWRAEQRRKHQCHYAYKNAVDDGLSNAASAQERLHGVGGKSHGRQWFWKSVQHRAWRKRRDCYEINRNQNEQTDGYGRDIQLPSTGLGTLP